MSLGLRGREKDDKMLGLELEPNMGSCLPSLIAVPLGRKGMFSKETHESKVYHDFSVSRQQMR